MSKLTIKQEAFVKAYIETGNASEAYRSAYNSGRMKPETVNREAKALLDNPKIAARVTTIQAAQQRRFEITQDRWLAEYAALGFSKLSDVMSWDERGISSLKSSEGLPDSAKAAVQSIEMTQQGLKIKLHDKKGALDAIGKHFGWFERDNKQKGEAAGEAAAQALAATTTLQLANAVADFLKDAKIERSVLEAAAKASEHVASPVGDRLSPVEEAPAQEAEDEPDPYDEWDDTPAQAGS